MQNLLKFWCRKHVMIFSLSVTPKVEAPHRADPASIVCSQLITMSIISYFDSDRLALASLSSSLA